jgi:hypothetical protein
MRCVAFAAHLLLLGALGQTFVSDVGKARMVGGIAPHGEIRSRVTNASTCLNESSSWGSCGSGGPAGIAYATTAQSWSQALSTALTGCPTGIKCATQTVTLPAGIFGIDVTTGLYQVYISDGANSEAVSVTGGTYTSGSGGTITFVPYHSHKSYTMESASSGIQETINIACGATTKSHPSGQCNVTIPANGGPNNLSGPLSDHPLNNYLVYGTIYFHAGQSTLSGYGVSLNCLGRGPCLQMGDLSGVHYSDMTVKGIHFRAPVVSTGDPAYAGSAITSTAVAGSVATITTASPHGFRPGDIIVQLFTDDASYWGDAIVTTVPSSTTYTYAHTGTIASQTTPGVTALAYEGILDNANSSHFIDVGQDGLYGESRHFNNFFDMWDDENATIDHFDNNAIALNGNANWNGSFVFSGGAANIGHQLAPVITIRDSNFTANYSSCVTDYNSNGLYFENSVCQATGLWQVYVSNTTGNYQGASLRNIYTESVLNPASPVHTPFPGIGGAGLIVGKSTGAASFNVATGGSTGMTGGFATGGTGTTKYTYYIVASDGKSHTNPMRVLDWSSTGSDSIPIKWPRVANAADMITYDVIRMTTPIAAGDVVPYNGGCTGGSGGTCGSVEVGLSQATACAGGLVCTYTDTGSSATLAYSVPAGNWNANINFWPGTLVSASSNTISVGMEMSPAVAVGGLNAYAWFRPMQITNECNGIASPGAFATCLASNGGGPNQTATLLTDGPVASSGSQALTKGRLNFTGLPGALISSHHFITLLDSQPGLTQSTIGYRPLASANDTYIGTDIGTSKAATLGQLSFGAPVAISSYIANTGDGTSWLERLTSKQKTFAVPVTIKQGNSFTLGDGSPLSQMKIYSAENIAASHVPPQSCVDVVGEAKGITRSDQITSITPPGRLGNLSLNAYPGGEGKIILHFCNPSASQVIIPPGAYSFLSVR